MGCGGHGGGVEVMWVVEVIRVVEVMKVVEVMQVAPLSISCGLVPPLMAVVIA